MSQLYVLDVGSLSDVGLVREINEDSYGVFEDYKTILSLSQDVVNRKGRLYALADGMGGHAAGEVASRKAIEVLFRQYYEDMDVDLVRSLEHAFWAANAEIYAHAAVNSAQSGMGTTLVAAVVQDDELIVANVGDSRAYLVKNGEHTQISRDHSWVGEQVEAGLLSEADAQVHMYRNIITRSLGSRPDVDVDTFSVPLELDDVVLLCSDGLSNEVSPDEISRIVADAGSSGEAAATLVDLANTRGGGDNVTALLVRISEAVPEKSPLPWIAVGALLTVLVLGMLGLCLSSGPLAGYVVPQFYSPTEDASLNTRAGRAAVPAAPEVATVPLPVPSSIVPSPTVLQVTSIAPTALAGGGERSATSTAVLASGMAAKTPRATAVLPVFGWKVVPPASQ